MARRTRRLRGIAAAAVCLAVLPAVAPGPSGAAGSYAATADARLSAVSVTTAPGIVFDRLADAGTGVTHAELDSIGWSRAYAAHPYPGGTVLDVPGLLSGSTGGATGDVAPPYPLLAQAEHPLKPDDRVEAGSVVLEASSRAVESEGRATDGDSRSSAEAAWDEVTETVTARASASATEVRVSDSLTLFGLRSTAEARQGRSGAIERSSEFDLAALSVLGQRVDVDDEALRALGQETAAGMDAEQFVPVPLLEALAAEGTTIEFLPADETEDGVTSAGLRVRQVAVLPPEVASGVREVVAEATFGAVSASLRQQVFDTDDGPGESTFGAPVETVGPLTLVSPPPEAGGPETSFFDVATPAGQPSASPRTALPVVRIGLPQDISIGRFYPVLLLAGALVVGLATLFRHIAVRTP